MHEPHRLDGQRAVQPLRVAGPLHSTPCSSKHRLGSGLDNLDAHKFFDMFYIAGALAFVTDRRVACANRCTCRWKLALPVEYLDHQVNHSAIW